MAKYRRFDSGNKKQSRDKRAKQGKKHRIHEVSSNDRQHVKEAIREYEKIDISSLRR